MADKPILFSAPMVRALLDGRKTQTRRIIKPQPPGDVVRHCWYSAPIYGFTKDHDVTADWHKVRLLAEKGDRLWCREMWSGSHEFSETPPSQRESFFTPDGPCFREEVWFWADGNPERDDWERPRPGIHMPRWASRITLIVTDVRVERLQDISEKDAEAEGVFRHISEYSLDKAFRSERGEVAVRYFRDLWTQINGPGAWDANPWVAAYTFTVESKNIDEVSL